MKLEDMKIGQSFKFVDKGFGGSGRVDKYYGRVIGQTDENFTAIRYGKQIKTGGGHITVDDDGEMPRVGLWDSRTTVEDKP